MFVVDLLLGLGVACLLAILFSLGRRESSGSWMIYGAFGFGLLVTAWLVCVLVTPLQVAEWHFHVLVIAHVLITAAIIAGVGSHRRQGVPRSASLAAAKHADFFALSIFFSAHALVYVALIGLRHLSLEL